MYEIGYYNPDIDAINPPIEQGSTFELNFTVTNVFANAGAGAVLRGKYRPGTVDGTPAVDFVGTIVSTTALLLTCKLTLSATTTAAMTPGTGFWDCEIQDSAGFVLKPLGSANKAKVIAEVTK